MAKILDWKASGCMPSWSDYRIGFVQTEYTRGQVLNCEFMKWHYFCSKEVGFLQNTMSDCRFDNDMLHIRKRKKYLFR